MGTVRDGLIAAIEKLVALRDQPDTENVHYEADGVLLKVLNDLGRATGDDFEVAQVIAAWRQLDKWYA